MGMLGHGEPTKVSNHLQDVLVDGVDMKEIVLHLTHDPPKDRQEAAEDAEVVHGPQGMHDAPR